MFDTIINTPVGKIGLKFSSGKLIKLAFLPPTIRCHNPDSKIAKDVCAELKKYFISPAHIFVVPFAFAGTPLQQKIWLELTKIPVGSTVTYKKLAQKLKTSPRVIGNACRSNPIPIILPCHRVVAVNGIGGYCGQKLGAKIDIKNCLLQHEYCHM